MQALSPRNHIHTRIPLGMQLHQRRGICVKTQLDKQVVLYTYSTAAAHNMDGHPESPMRMQAIKDALHSTPVLAQHLHLVKGKGRMPTMQELGACHKPAFVNKLQELSETLEAPTMVDDSTYISPGSYDAVAQTVTAVLDLADALMWLNPYPASSRWSASSTENGSQQRHEGAAGFALVRPPGHHVLCARPMGFGLLNTVSLAARHLQRVHGIQRVLIFDFDVHHGNGTMEAFYNDSSVLYISTHQDGLWPRTGRMTNRGEGEGEGFTINVPLPSGSGDEAMQQVFSDVLWPAARRFQPEFVLVSAGYDAHMADPLGQLQFKTSTYKWICAELAQLSTSLCGPGRLLFVLEGGYHLESLGASVAASIQGLLSAGDENADQAINVDVNDSSNTAHQSEPLPKVKELLQRVRLLHAL